MTVPYAVYALPEVANVGRCIAKVVLMPLASEIEPTLGSTLPNIAGQIEANDLPFTVSTGD